MIIKFLSFCSAFNNNLFEGIDCFISNLPLADWLIDAIIDSIHLVPLLFLIFCLIELIEYFLSGKIRTIVKRAEKMSIPIGATLAIIPQCGFSVIAAYLYLEKYLTKGALIAIFLATSDEAIPILLVCPNNIHYVVWIILTKLVVAIFTGYIIDYVLKDKKYVFNKKVLEEEFGCCEHRLDEKHKHKIELLIHPIKHTVSIFLFILGVTMLLNFLIDICLSYPFVKDFLHHVKYIAPVLTSIIGLVPNCAISVGLTMLLINGSLKFSAVIAGLLANAGLGVLVLFKQKNNFKDTISILAILLFISIGVGMTIQFAGL